MENFRAISSVPAQCELALRGVHCCSFLLGGNKLCVPKRGQWVLITTLSLSARYLTDDEIHALLDESDADLSDSEDIDSVAKDLQEDCDSESEMDDSPEDTNPLRRGGHTALKWSSGTQVFLPFYTSHR